MALHRVAERVSQTRRAAVASVAELTPGQRWTVSLMLALAVVVLAFGLPTATRLVLPGPPRAAAADEAGPSAAPVAPPVGQPGAARLVAPGVPSALAGGEPIAPPGTDAVVTSPVAAGFRVVALVDPSAGVGDRTDEAMARRYLAASGVAAAFVPVGDTTATCAAAQGASLVVAGGALAPDLTACLRTGGATVLGFDDTTVPGPVSTAVSTRRGAARSLLDTAARAAPELAGKLALVADERLRSALEPVLPAARSEGLDIVAVRWLAPGTPPAGVALDLAGVGVRGVLFATTTQNQSVIGTQLRTLSPAARLVVLDAADSVTTAAYPALFDGALAVTSIQLPWHQGAAAQRATCRATWETAQTPPVVLGDAELLRALTWCQHAAMAAAVADRADAGVLGALTGQTVASPVTSPLGTLPDGGFGPTLVTQATWSARCACWTATDPFTPASGA